MNKEKILDFRDELSSNKHIWKLEPEIKHKLNELFTQAYNDRDRLEKIRENINKTFRYSGGEE